jgi:hypothetical protein
MFHRGGVEQQHPRVKLFKTSSGRPDPFGSGDGKLWGSSQGFSSSGHQPRFELCLHFRLKLLKFREAGLSYQSNDLVR